MRPVSNKSTCPGSEKARLAVLALAFLLLVPTAGEVLADSRSQGGLTFVEVDRAQKPKKVDEMFFAARIPNDIDREAESEYQCILNAYRRDADSAFDPVGNVKASWKVMAYVVDHSNATFETLDVASGNARSSEFGSDFLSVRVPPAVWDAIFTDGFESGDVSAFLVGYARLRSGKKLTLADFGCDLTESNR